MKLPWQKDKATSSDAGIGEADGQQSGNDSASLDATNVPAAPRGYTAPKGRPTPSRRDAEAERHATRGQSLAPASSFAEDRKKRKELKASMSKEEYRELKRSQKEERIKRQKSTQAAMDRGEEQYLLPRDKGEVRRFARDWVDSRRFLSTWMMPVAIVLLLVMLVGNAFPELASFTSIFAMFLIFAFFIEGIFLGRRVNAAARAKFPGTTETGLGLGFYGYSRASQPRKWRTPKPRVELGADVK